MILCTAAEHKRDFMQFSYLESDCFVMWRHQREEGREERWRNHEREFKIHRGGFLTYRTRTGFEADNDEQINTSWIVVIEARGRVSDIEADSLLVVSMVTESVRAAVSITGSVFNHSHSLPLLTDMLFNSFTFVST